MKRLQYVVRPVPGESLLSLVTRLAWTQRTTIPAVIGAMLIGQNLSAVARIRLISAGWLSDDEIRRAADALGVAPEQLRTMILQSLEGRALRLNVKEKSIARHTLWSHPTRTTICPDCLSEDRGARQLSWRTVFHFLCLRHNRMLIDTCPQCQSSIPAIGRQLGKLTAPWTCAAPIEKKWKSDKRRHERCQFDLRQTAGEQVDPHHPVTRCQQALHELIYGPTPTTDVWADLTTYRALGIGLLSGCDSNELEQRAGLPRGITGGLWSPNKARRGTQTPDDTLHIAATFTAAHAIMTATKTDRFLLLKPLLDAAAATLVDTTPTARVRIWGTHASRFDDITLPVLDGDMRTVDRLRFRSPSVLPQVPTQRTDLLAQQRSRFIPQSIWPEAAMLHADAAVDLDVLREAMSVGALLPGISSSSMEELWAAMGHGSAVHPKFRGALFGEGRRRDAVLSLLCEIARGVDAGGRPRVDWARRRRIDYAELLPERTWALIAHHADVPPGGSARRLVAQHFLASRIAGTRRPYGVPVPSAAHRSSFLLGLTSALLDTLDLYGHAVIHKTCSTREPVVDNCPSTNAVEGELGPSIDALPLVEMHSALEVSHRLADIEDATGMTRSQIHLAQLIRPRRTEGRDAPHDGWLFGPAPLLRMIAHAESEAS